MQTDMSFCHIFFNLKSSTFLPHPHSPVMTLLFPFAEKNKSDQEPPLPHILSYTRAWTTMHLSTESQFYVLHAILVASPRVSPQLVSPFCPFHQLFPLYCIILIGIQTFCYLSYFLLKEKFFKKMSNLLLIPTFPQLYCLILLLPSAIKFLEEVTHIHCLQFLSSHPHKSTPTQLSPWCSQTFLSSGHQWLSC